MKPIWRILLVGLVAAAVLSLSPIPASAETLTVTRADDPVVDGCAVNGCSLREAITEADAGPADEDTIEFELDPDTPITPASALPAINTPVIIDGFSDDTSDRVELNGGSLSADGLRLAAEDSTIKGMVINNFDLDGIDVTGTGNRIEGNYIGTDASGSSAGPGNLNNGIHVQGPDNTIGGPSAEVRNVISGNAQNGVRIAGPDAAGNHVEGNYIGVTAAGNVGLGNTQNGIAITSTATGAAHNNVVGGTSVALRNVISGNTLNGVRIFPAPASAVPTGNAVQGNFIGSGADGTTDLGNGQAGVRIDGSSTGNSVGGIAAGAGNLISGNTFDGVRILGDATTQNAVLGNSIASNDQLGIDLEGGIGVNLNDPGDVDPGPNNLQNFPVLTSAASSATTTTINGTLNSEASKTYRLEFFANVTCDGTHGEGQTFLDATSATTDGAGNATFNASLPVAVPVGQVVTATATDPNNNTSEFSACTTVVVDTTPPVTPDTTPPTTPTTNAGGKFQKQRTFTVTWTTSTDTTGPVRYDVRYREAPYNGGLGGFVNWQSTTTATSATFTGAPGTTYCFSARAIDGAGNASPFGTEGCTNVPVDNPTFKHRGKWAKKTGAGYYLNTFSRTKKKGAKLTLPGVQAKALSVIVTKCKSCGVIKVFFKGKLLKRINLRSKAKARQKLRFVNLNPFTSAQTGTVRITVVSTRKLVIVEGLGVSAL
jgi:hypothetical protein